MTITTNRITSHTADEVLAAFEAHQNQHGTYLDDAWHEGPVTRVVIRDENGDYARDENDRLTFREVPFLLGGVPTEVKVVDTTGGEDEGSRASITFKVGSQFFKKDGYYASHYGYDWDGAFYEVKAVEKTVIVYE